MSETARKLYRIPTFLHGYNEGFGGPTSDDWKRNFEEFKKALEERERIAFNEAIEKAAKLTESRKGIPEHHSDTAREIRTLKHPEAKREGL